MITALTLNIGQYHECWCPGSLSRQDINGHDIDYVEYVGFGLTWKRILSTCVIPVWSNDMRYKYMIMFPLQNLAHKVNSMAPGRCGSYFKSIICKFIIQNNSLGTHCEIALRWTPQNLTNEKSTLVQVMAWCRQATSHYLNQCWPRSLSP